MPVSLGSINAQVVAALPSPAQGRIVFFQGDLYISDGTVWSVVGGGGGVGEGDVTITGSLDAQAANFHGEVIIGAETGMLQMYGTDTHIWMHSEGGAGERYIRFFTENNLRFQVGVTSTPETGSDTGSDFVIGRLQDNGTYENVLLIDRASGEVRVNNPQTDEGVANRGFVNDAIAGVGGGVTDHGALTGLNDPDHPIAAVSGLQAALDGKAPTVHTHTQAQSHTTPDTDSAPTALHHTIGTGANQAAAGNHTHTQAQSHSSPDTDSAPTALHHTLGTGANQAAPGNHLHTGVYDPAGTAAARTPKISIGTAAPGSPAVNDVWIDTN